MRTESERMGDLVQQLTTTYKECEWVEFKLNNSDPHAIGEYISALANAAAKVGNENLLNWLSREIKPETHIDFRHLSLGGSDLVILRTARAGSSDCRGAGRGRRCAVRRECWQAIHELRPLLGVGG